MIKDQKFILYLIWISLFEKGIIVQYYAAVFISVFTNSYAPPSPIKGGRIWRRRQHTPFTNQEQKRCYSATSLEKYNLSLYQNSRHLVFNFWLFSCWTLVFFYKNSKISLGFKDVFFCSKNSDLFIRSSYLYFFVFVFRSLLLVCLSKGSLL